MLEVSTLGHPNDEDQSLGTPIPQKLNAARVGAPGTLHIFLCFSSEAGKSFNNYSR